ncbi:GNAT family N-acetyltransferase [Streptomyces sp. NBC_01498]|uniref:GNAT family N-acetyltransferase n=1 Tax=Streptomyces sp. NBC_01498 TaxID=2975870 RepID=UPI002E7BAAEB|nr:GNAT family N-acetyltransferase [Streptomyces sp. NBC_01498]WTL28881.1 GNAT family N-acetyltransferase [Streptomyces sp. NBC_01498]
MDIRQVRYDHPDAVTLAAEVQLEYMERYGNGEGDATVLRTDEFDPPHGLYLLAYDADDRPVATGGWRSQEKNDEGYSDGDAEIKRMYVTVAARGLGLARRVLARLEEDARAAGRTRMVLETGIKQPEAIALYRSSGYTDCAKFGHYRNDPLSRCLAKPLI